MPRAEPSKTDRAIKALPAAGAVTGGVLGALRPGLIDAGRAGGDLKHRAAAALLGAGTGATLGWLPDVMREGLRAVKPEKVATAAVRGRELVQYMWDELEKISGAWEMGTRAKKYDKDQRPLAYAGGVGTSALVGAGAAALPGALLGGPVLQRALTEKGRAAALEDLGKDLGTAADVFGRARMQAGVDAASGAADQELLTDVMQRAAKKVRGKELGYTGAIREIIGEGKASDTLKHLGRDIATRASSPEFKELMSRRAGAAGKAMLTGAAGLAALRALYNVGQYEGAKALTHKEKRAFAESDPIAEVLGTEVEQLDQKRARGYPILQAPPGYVFNPELSAFVPDTQQPGWMPEEQVAQAQNNQQFYQQGQQDQQQGSAQQELDQGVEAQAQALAGQQHQAQQQQMMQDVQLQKQVQKLQQPPAITGAPAPQAPKPAARKPAAKKQGQAITIKVGK